MPKRGRPSAWAIAKAAQQMRTPYSKGGHGWGNKRPRIVPGYTRTAGPYRRALLGRPGHATMGGKIEKKYFDFAYGPTNYTTGGAVIVDLLAIAQGTTELTRVGGKINITNFNLRGRVDAIAAAAVPLAIRHILFWDKQTNGAAPAVTDLLTVANVNSFLNMDNVDRFQVIKDKTIVSNIGAMNSATGDRYGETKWVKFNIKVPNVPIHYSSTTGAIAEIKSNNLYLLTIADTAATATLAFRARTKFTDA